MGDHGLINPISLVENGNGTYRVIAGRRRLAAAKLFGWRDIESMIGGRGTYPAHWDGSNTRIKRRGISPAI
jgi:hypothetical protein